MKTKELWYIKIKRGRGKWTPQVLYHGEWVNAYPIPTLFESERAAQSALLKHPTGLPSKIGCDVVEVYGVMDYAYTPPCTKPEGISHGAWEEALDEARYLVLEDHNGMPTEGADLPQIELATQADYDRGLASMGDTWQALIERLARIVDATGEGFAELKARHL